MHIIVRQDGQEEKEKAIFNVSRILKVTKLKEQICERLKIEPDVQRLFYCGKQLENKYTLFDYKINENSVIQLVVREPIAENSSEKKLSNITKEKPSCSYLPTSLTTDDVEKSEESIYFKVGDFVDAKDSECGSWYIGKLLKIKKDSEIFNSHNPNCPVQNDGLVYVVGSGGEEWNSATSEAKLQEIRPHSREIIPFSTVKPGNKLIMNYNIEYPKERGYWYEVIVKEVKTSRRCNEVIGDVIVGASKTVLKNCHLTFLDDIYTLKPYTLLVNRTPEEDKMMQMKPVMRAESLYCIACKDDSQKRCKECGCYICGGKDNEDRQIMCDECNHPYHCWCLDPPVEVIPEDDDWYCPSCKTDENIIGAGQELKNIKTKASSSTRDWGKGYACIGRQKICTIVPMHHFGPIPGIEVGTSWLYRYLASESGVHRPSIGGIHGRDKLGAFSIAISGGYEDDVDNGEEFIYTGSGGRKLTDKNKRTSNQTFDQTLTNANRALALNCNAPLDDVNGAVAKDWTKGKPVRVLRSSKSKHRKYAPHMGYRYDGIYKVTKYYPARGLSGFIVWRFVLKRDDPTPAPWTEIGKKRIAKLGLEIIIPVNYEVEKSGSKRALKENFESNRPKSGSSKKGNMDRVNKKIKITYELEPELEGLIASDTVNQKYWVECKDFLANGKKVFLEKVEETFKCACCQDIVFDPITTVCNHNICKDCLKRSFAAEVFQCPCCRTDLDKNYSMGINNKLASALLFLFPGYNTDR